ncbi:MAG TPA: hypothetical protein PKM35_06530 [Holophaga sp.]|nr:hypothetical protein [Holophaga sp.]HPS66631.1 hypothetical protein [Holophaga sp.]
MSPRTQLTLALITLLLVTNLVFLGIMAPRFTRYMKWVCNGAFVLLFAAGLFFLTLNLVGEAFCVYLVGLALDRLAQERARPAAGLEADPKNDLPPAP